MTPAMFGTTIRSFDLGDVQPDLRGFSDALRGNITLLMSI